MTSPLKIPESARGVITKLLDAGYEAYLVGGTVRDLLYNRETKDYDITTSATPYEIKSIFKGFKVFNYGERHGTIGLTFQGDLFEITTFRTEFEYTDGRHPDIVNFVKNLDEDLARRDFTINALAADRNGVLIDLFNGMEDFKKGIIRTVGNPQDRFREDSLRILRAVRFAVRYNFKLDDETANAIIENSWLIKEHQISVERIVYELNLILRFPSEGIKLMFELKILGIILPELQQNGNISQIISKIESLNLSVLGAWALLFSLTFASNRIEKRNLSNTVSRFKGLKSYDVKYIEILVLNKIIPKEVLQDGNSLIIQKWLASVLHDLQGHPKLDAKVFVDDLWALNLLFSQDSEIDGINPQGRKIYSIIPQFLSSQLPIDGNDVKAIGFYGKSIGSVLKLARFILMTNATISKTRLLKILEDYKSPQLIKFEEISRNFISVTDGILDVESFTFRAVIQQIKQMLEVNLVHSPISFLLFDELKDDVISYFKSEFNSYLFQFQARDQDISLTSANIFHSWEDLAEAIRVEIALNANRVLIGIQIPENILTKLTVLVMNEKEKK